MSKTFRPWKIDQTQLLPPAVSDYVPGDHLAHFVVALARESLDLSDIIGVYKSALGQPPFDPRLMTARYGDFLRATLPPFWTTTDPALVRAALRRLAAASEGSSDPETSEAPAPV